MKEDEKKPIERKVMGGCVGEHVHSEILTTPPLLVIAEAEKKPTRPRCVVLFTTIYVTCLVGGAR
jgi:hypothetical protein